jgi:hypothetical protein
MWGLGPNVVIVHFHYFHFKSGLLFSKFHMKFRPVLFKQTFAEKIIFNRTGVGGKPRAF